MTGDAIEIDFTPKAPKVGKLVGIWDGSGIVFADGNRWCEPLVVLHYDEIATDPWFPIYRNSS